MFKDKKDSDAWNNFKNKYFLSVEQQDQFKNYFNLLVVENEKYNLTAITSPKYIIQDHFYDSLSLCNLYDLSSVKSLVDVGSGGGFPGLPLAIMNPQIKINLVEVNNKKINFLNLVIDELSLKNVYVHSIDWRTFLRSFKESIDIVTARASLQLNELLRVFKPSLHHQSAMLVYWASKKWEPLEKELKYLDGCKPYEVGEKNRSLCFFKVK